MKRAILVVFCLFLTNAHAGILAQTASPQTASKPTARPRSLSQAESFEFLKSLNEAQKLFPESYMLPLTEYKDLKAEGCFGVRLANGLRLVGESSGSDYGIHGYTIDKDGKKDLSVLIGVLHAEFPFSIGGRPLPRGPYVVHASQGNLELKGNHQSKMHYDSNRGKQVPDEKSEKLLLKVPLPEALLAEKATEIPRFSLAVEKGAIVLALHGNTWKLVPR